VVARAQRTQGDALYLLQKPSSMPLFQSKFTTRLFAGIAPSKQAAKGRFKAFARSY
jgi:hypothetical protein